MKELSKKEIQWLEAFAKQHEFFASFLLHYKLKTYLSNNQYYWLHLYINQAEESGDMLLTAEEVSFLGDKSESNEDLRRLMEYYKDHGYLENLKYKEFLRLKTNILGDIRKFETKASTYKHKVVKIPCPHCNFLNSPQISYCSQCGEPLPKIADFDHLDKVSDISVVDYTERHIILALEKLIDKSIPLQEKFEVNSTSYVKEGSDITGLSIFNCGLNAFPSEILRLKSLKYLALRRNNLNDLPKNIGFLSNLEWLDLRINQLENLPNAIGLLYKLKYLNLSSNNLTIIPDSIGELITLKKLNLRNNKLKHIPKSIENLNCLETLNLKANYWISIPESIENLKKQGLRIIV